MDNDIIQKNSYEYWNSIIKTRPRDDIITDDWFDMFQRRLTVAAL